MDDVDGWTPSAKVRWCWTSSRARQQSLKQAGIPTAVHYPIPVNQQPAVADPNARLPVGDAVAREVLSLPMHPYLSDDQAQMIAETLGAAVRA